jgi:O-methyltransferase domain
MSSASSQPSAGPDPRQMLFQLAGAHRPVACLYVATKLGAADFLAKGPQGVAELAASCGANEDALYRILRALASLGVFGEVAARTFANTPTSELLRRDVPSSFRDAVLFMSAPMHMRVFTELEHSAVTGGTALKKALGMDAFEYFRQNPEENQAFNAAMTSITAQMVGPTVDAYDFGETGTLADVGGGHGALLGMILQKHAGLRGIVYDLPHVVEGARVTVEALGLASRCEIVEGDFFQSAPAADHYVLKSVIHDWDDERAVTILKNCAKAMRGTGGKVILLDLMIRPGNEPDVAKWIDVEMLAMAGGRERTEGEHAALLAKAGLRLARVVRSASPMCAIEAVRA